MNLWYQIRLLMYKNWLLQKKKGLIAFVEIIIPVLLAIDLPISRLRVGPQVKGPIYYQTHNITHDGDIFVANAAIGYAPKTKGSEKVMNNVLVKLTAANPELTISMKGFNSEVDLAHFHEHNSERIPVLFVFNISRQEDVLPRRLQITIRPTQRDASWKTWIDSIPFGQSHSPRVTEDTYKKYGFLFLQSLTFQAVTDYWLYVSGERHSELSFSVLTKRLASAPFSDDSITTKLRTSLSNYIFLSFFISVIIFTKMMVYEKEKQINEYLRLIGLSQSAQRIAWFLTFCCYIVPIMAMYAALLCLEVSSNGPVLLYTNGFIFFLFLLSYGIAIITFCFMVGAFVYTANTGLIVAGNLYFTFYIPRFLVESAYMSLSRRSKLLYCLSFNCAMVLGLNSMIASELEEVGVQWSNIHKPATKEDNLSVLDCLIMMLIDSAIHALIAWYLENVWPGEFGVPKPFNFCLNKSYWTSKSPTTDVGSVPNLSGSKYFEKEPTDKTVGIRISNLKKVFGTNVAVNGTSLNMYKGQITVLLGHNGAGKTTVISMLTGFIPPTSGTAFINGHDIRTNLSAARESLGLCPQHDILFDSLTVDEHLTFFAKVKNVNSSDLEMVVGDMAKKVELDSKMTTPSKFLSGGQKRKLSVAIALLGSKVVVLDEPTSGIKPSARRHIWSVLQEVRRDTTILLSTHFMDEADVLGDRIAIMAHGVVTCCGSSIFLKNLYGNGYRLIVVIQKTCQVSSLTRFVSSFILNAELESVTNTEVTYFLPDSQSNKFANLFRNLEGKKQDLKIISFGASATTMEDVFFKAGVEYNTDDPKAVKKEVVIEADSAAVTFSLVVVKKPTCDNDILTNTITSLIPRATVVVTTQDSNIYCIPDWKEHLIDDLRSNLQNRKNELGIASFNIFSESKISEDVAVDKIANHAHIYNRGGTFRARHSRLMEYNTGVTDTAGIWLEWSCMQAMVVKRIIYTKRKLVLTLFLMACPVLLTWLSLHISTAGFIKFDPYLNFDLSPFGETYIPFTDGETSTANTTKFVNLYARQFGSSHKTEYFKTGKTATFDNYTLKRAEDLGPQVYNRRLIIGMEIIDQQPNATACCIAYYSGQPYHSEPISVNYLLNTILQSLLNETFSLQTAIHPLSMTVLVNKILNGILSGWLIAIFLSFGMSFVVALLVYFLIMEREVGSRHMQAICGVRPMTYWLPNLLWDFLHYLIPILIIVMLLLVYGIPALANDGRWALTGLVLVLYCWAVLSQMYAVQFLFTSALSGVAWALLFNISTGAILAPVADMVSDLVTNNLLFNVVDGLLLFLLPHYNLNFCIINMFMNYYTTKKCTPLQDYCLLKLTHPCCPDNCGNLCLPFYSSYVNWAEPGIGRLLFFLFMQGAMYFMIVMMLEYRVVEMVKYFTAGSTGEHSTDISHTEDEDVAAERTRINSTNLSLLFHTDSLVLVNLYKRYKHFVAVDRICLGVPERECFGLLGQNGAGKTSTFKMLTGAENVTEGNAYLNGYDLKTQIQRVQSKMGYCPQFDALIPEMTGRETLTMYARLRGIPGDTITTVVEMLADRLNVTPHIDKYVSQYSGGNKRKLSTAVALVDNPRFLILDEPSSGMDPGARRHLWRMLSKVRASGCTLVLTSRSMEEYDALCTRLAIMVNGRFVCLGSPQHLKNKFGQGYTLITELGVLENRSTPNRPVIDFMLSHFPGASVFDYHQGYIHFQVPDATVKLADIFDVMETAKSTLNVKSYYVQQTSLENIFLILTKNR